MKKVLVSYLIIFGAIFSSVAVHAQIVTYGPWNLVRSKSYVYKSNDWGGSGYKVYCHWERKVYPGMTGKPYTVAHGAHLNGSSLTTCAGFMLP